MSDETTTAPAAESAAPAAQPTETSQPAQSAAAPEENHGIDAAALDALAGDDALTGDQSDTITIGEHTIPLSALADLPDDALRRIKRKVRFDGEEVEVSLADAMRAVQKGRGAEKRVWEAAQYEKRLKAYAEDIKRDPVGATMRFHGISRAEAVDILANPLVAELEEAELSPQERAERHRRRELEERARAADEYERREREAQMTAETKRAEQVARREMGTAIAAAGLPQSQHTIARMATLLSGAYEAGVIRGDAAPEHYQWAAETVAKELGEERAAWIGDADGDALIERLGPELARKVARAYAQRVRAQQPPPERAPGQGPRRSPDAPQRFESMREWKEWADKRMG